MSAPPRPAKFCLIVTADTRATTPTRITTGFEQTGAEVPESDTFVLPLDDGIERDPATYDGKDQEYLEETTEEDAGICTGTGDVGITTQERLVKDSSPDRGDFGDQVEHTCGNRIPSHIDSSEP